MKAIGQKQDSNSTEFEGIKPRRAFQLILKMDADSRQDLVSALTNLAIQIDREEITIGCSGGVNSGYLYELLVDPDQTHESYFQQLSDYLSKKVMLDGV